jgi:hypothetical protein
MSNEWLTHDDIQNCIRRAHQARSMYLAELIARGIDASGPLVRKPLVVGATAFAVLMGGVLVQADPGSSSTRPHIFAAACAEREAALITLAKSRDDDPTAALAQAGLKLMTARNDCHEGKIKEAVALYDELIRQAAAPSHVSDAAE